MKFVPECVLHSVYNWSLESSKVHTARFHIESGLKNVDIRVFFFFFHLFVALLQEAHFHKGIIQKSFQC